MVHKYLSELAFTPLPPSVTVTVVLAVFAAVVLPFVPNVTVGPVLSIFIVVELSSLTFPALSMAL